MSAKKTEKLTKEKVERSDTAIQMMALGGGIMICPYCTSPIVGARPELLHSVLQCRECFLIQARYLTGETTTMDFGPDQLKPKGGTRDAAI